MKYALRQLRRSPGFTLLATLTLALGIGASTAIFTIVDSVILKPLTYRESQQLAIVWERVKFITGIPYVGANVRHVDYWQKHATAFRAITFFQENSSGVSLGAGHPQIMGVVRAYPNFLEVLQVEPLIGRNFSPDAATPGRDRQAILTYNSWQTLFGGKPDVIGKTVRVSDAPLQIIGVLPRSFRFPNANALDASQTQQAAGSAPEPAIITAAALNLSKFDWNGEYGNWIALGRLAPGVTIARAAAQLDTLEAQIVNQMPAAERDNEPNALLSLVQPMQEAVVGSSRAELWLLFAAVLGLMLIACVNLANAQLGRGLLREREASIRRALGAAKWNLLADSLRESLLLAIAGGAAGLALAYAGLRLFLAHTPVDLPRLGEIHLNGVVLLFAAAAAVASTLLFGLVPVVQAFRTDPQRALQTNTRGAQGSRRSRQVRRILIGVQVFGSTALLLVTGLFVSSLLHLMRIDKGFDAGHVTAAEIDLRSENYNTSQKLLSFQDGALANLRALPGVRSAALISAMPLAGETWVDGIDRADRHTDHPPLANIRWVSANYFETLREPLAAGRFFGDTDRGHRVVVISQAAAHAAWPGESPVGRQIRHQDKLYTVIGVAADARNNSIKRAPANMVYFLYDDDPPYFAVFLVRSSALADALFSSVRRAIWSQDPGVPITHLKTLDAEASDSLAPERFQTGVLLLFAAAALLLAMLGVYGVLSYLVAGRRQEIGIRIALGATRPSIYSLTLIEALVPVLAGLAAGWIASLALARAVQSLLFGVQGVGITVSMAVALLFLAAATAAAFLPARRAATVDPMEALRTE